MIPSNPSVATADGSKHVPPLTRDFAGVSQALGTSTADFWENYQAFRATYDLAGLDISTETFAETRDRSTHPVQQLFSETE